MKPVSAIAVRSPDVVCWMDPGILLSFWVGVSPGYCELTWTGYPLAVSGVGGRPSCSAKVLRPSPTGSPGQNRLERPVDMPESAFTLL